MKPEHNQHTTARTHNYILTKAQHYSTGLKLALTAPTQLTFLGLALAPVASNTNSSQVSN